MAALGRKRITLASIRWHASSRCIRGAPSLKQSTKAVHHS